MQVITTKDDFKAAMGAEKAQRRSIGLVPTMGALHDGHISLVRQSRASCDLTAATIFVNPLQFGENEDFGVYPRTLESDLAKLERAGADVAFVPAVADIYPDGFETSLTNSATSRVLCGAHRPGHFDGVLTVVLKLLNMSRCDRAFFGKKDYQQLTLIRRMALDLDVPAEIVGCETVREETGLARSSRNAYLSADDRARAVKLSAALMAMRSRFDAGERDVSQLMLAAAPVTNDPAISLDYLEIRSPDLATRFERTVEGPAVVLIAAKIGSTRLIDNMELGEPAEWVAAA